MPILTLGFDVPLAAAVGTSLICVIATSTGAAAINVRAGRADVRLGITLGAGTVVGALTGGVLAGFLPERAIAGLFAALLAYTAFAMLRAAPRWRSSRRPTPARLSTRPLRTVRMRRPTVATDWRPPSAARSSPATCQACSASEAAS